MDYNKLKKEAQLAEISVHLMIKRKINYRKKKQDEIGCSRCKYMHFIKYNDFFDNHMQCSIIGESFDRNADVDGLHICNEVVQYY